MEQPISILKIAIDTPLHRCFDYLPPVDCQLRLLKPGMRLWVPFGRREIIGILLEISHFSDHPLERLKPAIAVIDEIPIWSPTLLKLLQWASAYYHYPIGEVVVGSLPSLLQKQPDFAITTNFSWQLTKEGLTAPSTQLLKRAHQQARVIELLKTAIPEGLSDAELKSAAVPRSVLLKMLAKNWITPIATSNVNVLPDSLVQEKLPVLNEQQHSAVTSLQPVIGHFEVFLLQGITGSGKTEVYLQVIAEVLARGLQALVLVPEIGLTPQLLARFQQRFACSIGVLHSGISDHKRAETWLKARDENLKIIIGTRSAIYTPMKYPGIIIIDEEHDVSFKQQEGFRYSARDLAVMRGRLEHIPVILGSATPSLETYYNAKKNRYQWLHLSTRASGNGLPQCHVLDIRKQALQAGLAPALVVAMQKHLQQGQQVLLFINRRGYAPRLICHACGWVADCKYCDARMTLHQQPYRLHCHYCEASYSVEDLCPKCHEPELLALGLGTQRIEQELALVFPHYPVIRIDRDTTRRKNAMSNLLSKIVEGRSQILVGTQILAKGHHFPNVTLAVVIDTDYGLFSNDFRTIERIGQLLIQVGGRSGRADKPGEVIIQTRHPEHPAIQELINNGYTGFAEALLIERYHAQLPPFTFLALIRAESTIPSISHKFLKETRDYLASLPISPHVKLLGPVAAPMERRAGRHRAQLLLQAKQRSQLQGLLKDLTGYLEHNKKKGIRWSLDVDPIDLF